LLPEQKNIKLVVQYDGSRFCGFAKQPEVRTVAGEIERSLKEIVVLDGPLVGAGRTDSGVHALGQVVNFKTSTPFDLSKYPGAINFRLSDDVRVLSAKEVPLDFSARHSAKSKIYRYQVYEGFELPYYLRFYAILHKRPLNIEKMREAAKHFLGKKDYTSFASDIGDRNPVREIYGIEIVKEDNLISFFVNGKSFLYRMVRTISGTLLSVGEEKIKPEEIADIFEAKDRRRAGKALPPQGLSLISVDY